MSCSGFLLLLLLLVIITLKNAADQNWTLSNLTTYNGKEVLISTDTLARFKEFIESKKLPFAYDLAIGLFKYKKTNSS